MVEIPDADLRLSEALAQAAEGDPRGIEMGDILLRNMKTRGAVHELRAAASRWLEGGRACMVPQEGNPAATREKTGFGNNMLRMGVHYLKAAGSDMDLIRFGKQQESANKRLALRAYASVSKECDWKAEDRDAVLALAEAMQTEVECVEDATRVRDVYLTLGAQTEMTAFADYLENHEHPKWARMVRASIEDEGAAN